ncbi:MAG: ATP-binding protein, partial [Flammeovirgaceae bacterium]|nr:ATP-binding protein [Flammeovirgaceae bacterium]
TDGGFVNILNRKKGTIEKIKVTVNKNTNPVVPVYFQPLDNRTLLVGSSIGLLQLDKQRKTFSYFKPLQTQTQNRMVRQVLKVQDYLYLIQSGALLQYNLKTNSVKVYTDFSTGKERVVNVTCIYVDSLERIWLGVSGGLSLFDPGTGKFQFFAIQNNTRRPKGTYFMVLSIYEHKEKLWVGTFNTGLWVMDLKSLDTPAFINLTEEDGLPNNTIYSTLPDEDGNLWLSTNRGISKYNPDQKTFLNFGPSEGLQNEEFNRLAHTRCTNGDLVFGGINGINIFDPEEISVSPSNYSPSITHTEIYSFQDDEISYKALHNVDKLVLKHHQNHIDISFLIPNYNEPKRCDVYYMLENFEPDWRLAESNILQYANIKPGNYTLRIKTITLGGAESEIALPIQVQWPFWQTWWFITLILLLIIGLVYLLIRERIRQARFEKEKLEVLLKIRTHEIERSREELAVLNEKKDLIFSILSHDLRAPLTTLKGFLSLLVDDTRSFSKEEIKKHAATIRQSVTNSLDLIDNTLFWSLSQMGGIQYEPSDVPLKTIIDNIKGLYSLTAEKKQIQLVTHCDDSVIVWGDENMIYVSVRNLVSNALKFTPEGKEVNVTIHKNQQHAIVKVRDQGIGMNQEYIAKLMKDEQPSIKRGTSSEKGTGLGLFLCKKFISLNKGTLEVTSVEESGTEFTVKLPLSTITA